MEVIVCSLKDEDVVHVDIVGHRVLYWPDKTVCFLIRTLHKYRSHVHVHVHMANG